MKIEGRVAALVVLGAVFLAGGLGGAAVMKIFQPDPFPRWEGRGGGREGSVGPGQNMRRRVLGWPRGFAPMTLNEHLADALSLTEEQRAEVRRIMEERAAQSAKLFQELEPRLRAQLDSARMEIRALLNQEQQKEFDRFLERERDLFQRRMPRPDSARPPGNRGGEMPGLPPPR